MCLAPFFSGYLVNRTSLSNRPVCVPDDTGFASILWEVEEASDSRVFFTGESVVTLVQGVFFVQTTAEPFELI